MEKKKLDFYKAAAGIEQCLSSIFFAVWQQSFVAGFFMLFFMGYIWYLSTYKEQDE